MGAQAKQAGPGLKREASFPVPLEAAGPASPRLAIEEVRTRLGTRETEVIATLVTGGERFVGAAKCGDERFVEKVLRCVPAFPAAASEITLMFERNIEENTSLRKLFPAEYEAVQRCRLCPQQAEDLRREPEEEQDENRDHQDGQAVENPLNNDRAEGRAHPDPALFRDEIGASEFSQTRRDGDDCEKSYAGDGEQGELIDLLQRAQDKPPAKGAQELHQKHRGKNGGKVSVTEGPEPIGDI